MFYGWIGSPVNERQLIKALSKKTEKCYLFTFIGFKQIFTIKRNELKNLDLPKNLTVIPISFLQLNTFINYLVMMSVSCILSIIGSILYGLKVIDAIYIRHSFLSVGFLTFRYLAKRTIVKIPAIIDDELSDGVLNSFLKKRLVPIMDRMVLNKARFVAVNGLPLYNELVKRRMLIHKHSALEISPGVDLKLIEKIKKQLLVKSNQTCINIGFIGSLYWWQGVDVLVEAIGLLKIKVPNVKLIIIGDGQDRHYIEYRCKSLNLDYEITGILEHKEALKRLAMLDVFVMSSKRMSTREFIIPIKVFEAWALGIPVIVTKHQVFIKNGIKDFKEVIYCEPEPESLYNAILTLIADSTLKEKLKKSGPILAKRFDYAEIVDKLFRAFEEERFI